MHGSRNSMVLALILLSAARLVAQQQSPDYSLEPSFDFSPGFRTWGADIGFSYAMPLLSDSTYTRLLASVGGGYEEMDYFRNPDGSLYKGTEPGTDPDKAPFYDDTDFEWSLGVAQGILRLPDAELNTMEVFLLYRGRYDDNHLPSDTAGSLFARSGRADARRIVQNSAIVGLNFNTVRKNDSHELFSGFSAETSMEYFPPFAIFTPSGSSMGALRFNLTTAGYLPIFDLNPGADLNVLSFYAADFFSVDYALPVAGGRSSIPFNVLQSFGGTQQRTGLGGMVRGTEDGNYDAPLKAVNCLDLRLNLPSLFDTDIVPTLLVFFDSGYYGSGPGRGDGFLFSTGGGFYIDILGLATMGVGTHLLLNRSRVGQKDGWESIVFDFGMHF